MRHASTVNELIELISALEKGQNFGREQMTHKEEQRGTARKKNVTLALFSFHLLFFTSQLVFFDLLI
jgi:hypothetical protein